MYNCNRSPFAAFGLLFVVAAIPSLSSCADFLAGLSRDRPATVESDPPPDLAARRFGRWTCAAELPFGRPSSVFELLRRVGPGKAWNVIVDADGLAQLQVVGRRGRTRQGCWAELSPDELANLERRVRGEGLCDRPDEPRGSDGQSAFDFEIHFGELACARHVAASSLLRSASGRRFADEMRGWLDSISNGSFDKVEAFALSNPHRGGGSGSRAPTGPAPIVLNGRLTCAAERTSIYEPGDSWLLDYSFQRGLLWRRDLQVSAAGAAALDFASLQSRARYVCTGELTPGELAKLRESLEQSRPCALPSTEPRHREDRAYLSVHDGGTLCRSRVLRADDLASSRDGRRLDQAVMEIVAALAGPGGTNPFDPQVGLLFERSGTATPSRRGNRTASDDRAQHQQLLQPKEPPRGRPTHAL